MRFPEGPIIFTSSVSILKEISRILGNPDSVQVNDMAMRFELATRSVTSPNSENFAPLELQDSLT